MGSSASPWATRPVGHAEATRRPHLHVAVESPHPVVALALGELAWSWTRATGGWVVPWAGTATVRLRLGSLVRPSVVVDFDVPYEPIAAAQADALALTTAAWDGLASREPWRDLSAPLDPFPHLGQPDPRRPWVLSAGSQGRADEEAQRHVLGVPPRPAVDVVWWLPGARVAAALLGRVDRVLGDGGALVYDAVRAGVATSHPIDVPRGSLAGLVPPTLLHERSLWDHVVEQALARAQGEHHTAEPLMTAAWVEIGRREMRRRANAPPASWERAQRRYAKLRRDPARFFADSRHPSVRRLGVQLYGPAGPGDR